MYKRQELVTLLDKTQRDLIDQQNLVGGTVSIGCVESSASKMLPEILSSFAKEHPMVCLLYTSFRGCLLVRQPEQGKKMELIFQKIIRAPLQNLADGRQIGAVFESGTRGAADQQEPGVVQAV